MILFWLATPWPVSAQTRAQTKADADRLAMTCAQILRMSSTEWIAYFGDRTKSAASDPSSRTQRAVAVYGTCYQARTDALAQALARNGEGPPKAVRADFAGFEAALKNFTAKALADTQPPADPEKRALAALYEDQFRYQFYQKYAKKSVTAPSAAKTPLRGSSSTPAEKNAAPASREPSLPVDTDPMTNAKNQFGALLGALPDDKLHELHGAFGEVLGLHALDEAMRLAVYRYAIFLLEPSPGESSYPPPF
jgi:hypothetical protein